MKKINDKEKAKKILEILKERYPDAVCSLEYKDEAWQLLIMARLSAQCTDARVNLVSKELFAAYQTPSELANADVADVERLIFSCGLYKTKAKSIIGISREISEKYGGRVPDHMEELLSLPGVGRKIANLILGDVYGKGGIVADTHCIRISARLGFTKEGAGPLVTERTLDGLVPKNEQSDFCHRLVYFGRDICRAKSPKCSECPILSKNSGQKLCRFGENEEPLETVHK